MNSKQSIALTAGFALVAAAACLYMMAPDGAGHEPVPERAVGDPPTREARRAPSPYNPAPRAAPPEVASFEPTKPGPEGADWMRPATSVELDRVRASGREWIYGWLERPVPPGTVVVGTAGRFVRARLPADAGVLVAMGAGFVAPERKLRTLNQADGRVQVFVTLMDDDPGGLWARSMEALGADVGRYDPDLRVYLASVTWPVAVALAAEDYVLDLRPVGTVTAAHDTLVPALGVDALRTWNLDTGRYTGTAGASVPIGVLDSGLNIAHEDIRSGRDTICGANLVGSNEVTEGADLWIDQYGHGTHITGTMAGSGTWARRYTGVAPSVRRIRIGKVLFSSAGWGTHDMVTRGIDYMADDDGCGDGSTGNKPLVVNMSLAIPSNDYDGRGAAERKVDAAVWNHRQLYVSAQANDSVAGYSEYSAAKNTLAVGAVQDSGDIAYFSSLGPTVDGRLSPNLVGIGVAVNSAEGNGSRTGYVRWSGTSMSAPTLTVVADDDDPDHISLDVSVDGYVAAGVRLHMDCRGDGCGDIGFDSMAVTREDGTVVDLTEDMSCVSNSRQCYAEAIELGGSLPLGEVAVGETQTVELGVDVPPGTNAVLRFTATGWNAAAGHDSVVFNRGPAVSDARDNDGFALSEEISGESGSRSVDLFTATTEQGEPHLVYRLAGPRNARQPNTREWYGYHLGRPAGSVWFSWTAPAGGRFRFALSPASDLDTRRYDRVDVFTGNSLGTLVRKGSGDSAAVVMARRGTTYRVRVANFLRGEELELNWSRHEGAINNYFVSAVRLSGESGTEEGTSVDANTETGELLPLAATTWFRWEAPSSGDWRFQVDALDDTPSPVTALFTGTSVDSLRLVSGHPGPIAAARLEGGTEYRVVVAERSAYTATGRYRLSWEKSELAEGGGNDFHAGAAEIRNSAVLTQQSVEIDAAATVEPGEPTETGVRTKWWHWTAAADGVHTMHMAPDPGRPAGTATQSAQAAVFSGDSLSNLVHLGGTALGGNPEVQWDAENGIKYHIALGMLPQSEQVVTRNAVYGLVTLGRAPANDTEDAAAELTGMSGGRRGVRASNRHAGSESPIVAAEIGWSTVWWTWTAEESGWMEFSARNGPWIIAVHEDGAVTASSRWQRTEGAGTDPARVLFDAVEGRTYTLSVGVPASRTGGTITLRWDRTEPPTWLTVAGRLVDGSGTEIRAPGSMVVHASGTPLYLASSIGLQVFDRDGDSGRLELAQTLDAEADALLLRDAANNRLLVEKCGDWAAHGETDDGLTRGAALVVADDPGRCGNQMLIHGASIYRTSDRHIDLFDVGANGMIAYSAATEISNLVQAAVSPSGGHVYALTDTKLLTYARADDGTLTKLEAESEPDLYLWARSLSISKDGSLLFVAINDDLDYGTVVYDLETPESPARIGELYPYGRKAGFDDRECRVTAARSNPSGADVVCRDMAYAFLWDAGAEESVDRGKFVDHLFSGEPDRHNALLPEYGTPVAAAASPDGRHLYVSTETQGVLIFGRAVGTPDNPEESR